MLHVGVAKRVVLLLGVLALAAPARSQKIGGAEAELKRIEQERVSAMVKSDIAALARILSGDLTYAHSTGEIQTKDQFLESLRSSELRYEKLEEQGVQVRVIGDAAVLTGTAQVDVTPKGTAMRHLHIRWIDVYARRHGRWQMIAWQSTLIQ
jgi:uncharacterized protein (TIGR02246 family)